MKEFTDLRTEISEHVGVPAHSMPPNILILRRKTIRQFPGNLMVALYFNDKLNQYFSIPYGSAGPDDAVITPVALKEEEVSKEKIKAHAKRDHETVKDAKGEEERKAAVTPLKEEKLHAVGDEVRYRLGVGEHLRVGKVVKVEPEHLVVHRKEPHGGKYGYHYKVPKDVVSHNSRTGYTREELNEISIPKTTPVNEDAISHLQKVKAFSTDKPLYHKDGSQTKIDPTTAHALLTVHSALHPDNRKKFADALEHSKGKFNRMLDFSWKNVK